MNQIQQRAILVIEAKLRSNLAIETILKNLICFQKMLFSRALQVNGDGLYNGKSDGLYKQGTVVFSFVLQFCMQDFLSQCKYKLKQLQVIPTLKYTLQILIKSQFQYVQIIDSSFNSYSLSYIKITCNSMLIDLFLQ
ncbi:Hypothetical_protein [Hexamita inflata]|uniref:Hypothetical_protein n=1 Tax=Hexamita inflata TaxID=28002 RepID=A0AA86RIT0_9EUKA|nr:Hypothetical protein HINF_LOCUS61973 [Hexamita inflata]